MIYNPFSLENKTILVTGASSGIGRSISIECSKIGANVIITGRNDERLNYTYNKLKGTKNKKISADLSTEEGIEKVCNFLPRLDGIVNCAGIVKPTPFRYLNKSKIDELMQINFVGPTLLNNNILRKKLLNNNSSIVFISSISGVYCSSVGGSLYGSSKGAINGMAKGMALDLASKKIRVNSITPGMIDTGIFEESSISENNLENDRKNYPLGRYGKPEEVAYATIFLLSDASTWITGSNLLIDGGFTLK